MVRKARKPVVIVVGGPWVDRGLVEPKVVILLTIHQYLRSTLPKTNSEPIEKWCQRTRSLCWLVTTRMTLHFGATGDPEVNLSLQLESRATSPHFVQHVDHMLVG